MSGHYYTMQSLYEAEISPLSLMRPMPYILDANAAAPLFVAVARGTNGGLKGRALHRM